MWKLPALFLTALLLLSLLQVQPKRRESQAPKKNALLLQWFHEITNSSSQVALEKLLSAAADDQLADKVAISLVRLKPFLNRHQITNLVLPVIAQGLQNEHGTIQREMGIALQCYGEFAAHLLPLLLRISTFQGSWVHVYTLDVIGSFGVEAQHLIPGLMKLMIHSPALEAGPPRLSRQNFAGRAIFRIGPTNALTLAELEKHLENTNRFISAWSALTLIKARQTQDDNAANKIRMHLENPDPHLRLIIEAELKTLFPEIGGDLDDMLLKIRE